MTGNFIVYLIGYIIIIVGVAYGMSAAGLGEQWILPVVLVMAGVGIIYALSRSQADKQSRSSSQPPQQTTQIQNPPKEREASHQ